MERKNNVSGYRWVILMAIVPMIISTEMMWLSLSPISSLSAKFYGVSTMSIDMLAVSYMIMFIVFSIPASWIVDKFGYRHSLIIGAVLTAVFGIVRAVFAGNFTVVLIAQFMIAIGQPFLLNISTKVPANWFPINERSTAAGILTMAQYAGFIVPMLLSPGLAESQGIPGIMKLYATIAVISALVCIIFTREKPRVAPPGPIAQREDLSKESVMKLIKNKPYMTVLLICFISMGIFNSVMTLLETILLPLGISSAQSGIIGAIFVISGVLGAIILPVLSDKTGTRIPFFVGSIIILIPVYIGFTFLHNFYLLAFIAILAGFCIMGVAPILFQHGSEVAYPVQEGTSLGMILLMGQISGVLIVYIFEVLKDLSGDVVLPMLLIVLATVLELPIVLKIKESEFNRKQAEKEN